MTGEEYGKRAGAGMRKLIPPVFCRRENENW